MDSKTLQTSHIINKHKDAAMRHSPIKKEALMTEYSVLPLFPQFGNSPSSFPQPAAPYQQYTGPAPPQPNPYQQNQQFSTPGPQYPYNQQPPQQPYRAPPAVSQYGPGYQAPQYNQHPQANGPPQSARPNYPNGPQQYGPPQPPKPYQQPENTYSQNGNFPGNLASMTPFQTPNIQASPQSWNNAPTVSASRASYQRPQRNYSGSSFNSATPDFQVQSHQGSTERAGSQNYQQTVPLNMGTPQHMTPTPFQSSPARVPSLSKVSSTSSTPYARLGALDNDVIKEIKPEPLADDLEKEITPKKEQDEQKEDGEVPEEDEEAGEDAVFVWEYEAIFLDPPGLETVALAQPLSTNFKTTPVPLLDHNSKNSVSRYARKENIKEFIKPITLSPQWSYLKEDPAFADTDDDDLVPLSHLSAWIIARHDSTVVVEEPFKPSRKRSRSTEQDPQEQDAQMLEDVDISPKTASETPTQGPPSKRIKKELLESEKLAAPTTVLVTSPVNVGRAGTPCLTTEDDAWAPDPGEVAAPPMSTTEAILASLGVTGSPKPPKPLRQDSIPLSQGEETQHTPYKSGPSPNSSANQSTPQAPTQNFQGSQPPMSANYGNPQPPSNFPGPTSNQPFPNNQNRPPHGPQPYQPYTNGPQPRAQFAPPPNNYQNGAPVNNGFNTPQYPNQQYAQPVPLQNGGQQYGPPAPQQNGNQQYRPPVNPALGNGPTVNDHYGAAPQGPPQYGNAPLQNAPSSGPQYNQGPQYNNGAAGPYVQQSNPQFGNGLPTQQLYGPQGNPHFATGPPNQQQYGGPQQQAPNSQFGSGPPPQQQYGPPHANHQTNNGLPIQQQYNAAPQGNPQFGNGAPPQQQYGVGQHGNPQFGNGPPPQQEQFGAPQSNPQFGNGPPTQQQQYGPTPQGNPQYPNALQQQQYGPLQNNPQFGNGDPAQHQQQQQQTQPYSSAPQINGVPRQDSGYASAHGSYSNDPSANGFNNQENFQAQGQQPYQNGMNQPSQDTGALQSKNMSNEKTLSRDDNSEESLSPDSLEILGKLIPGTDTRKMANGRTYEIKLKRPAPVIEAAYSRRW